MKLVYGIAVNDADYPTQPYKGKACPTYVLWKNMLRRCLCEKEKQRQPSVKYSSVCNDWLYFMAFKAWCDNFDWVGLQLDKDILFPGNKVYSPETCVFIPSWINSLLNIQSNSRGKLPLGVSYKQPSSDMKSPLKKPFAARVQSRNGDRLNLGVFCEPMEAHRAWQKAKIVQLKSTIKEYKTLEVYDPRVEISLLNRIKTLEDPISNNMETMSI